MACASHPELMMLTTDYSLVTDEAFKPMSRLHLRCAVLKYGAALLTAYPSLSNQLVGSGPLVPILAEQYASGGRAEGSARPPPPHVRRLALTLLHQALDPDLVPRVGAKRPHPPCGASAGAADDETSPMEEGHGRPWKGPS